MLIAECRSSDDQRSDDRNSCNGKLRDRNAGKTRNKIKSNLGSQIAFEPRDLKV